MIRLLKHIFFKLYLNFGVGAWYTLKEQVWDRHNILNSLPTQENKTFVITGGTRGIGLEAVKTLLSVNSHILMGCRKVEEAKNVFDKLREDGLVGGKIEFLSLDLMKLASVKSFGQAILEKQIPLHALINNAGIMFGDRHETEDGFESQLATNYIGHFLLTHILLPVLERTGTADEPARIVNVSSSAHFLGSWMDLDDPNLRNFYNPEQAYGNSKVAQILFTDYLDALLQSKNVHVRVLSLHPGIVLTDLYTNVGWVKWFNFVAWFIMKTPAQGGETVVNATICPQEFSGKKHIYLENSKPAYRSSFTSSVENQAKLWGKTCKMLSIQEFGRP